MINLAHIYTPPPPRRMSVDKMKEIPKMLQVLCSGNSGAYHYSLKTILTLEIYVGRMSQPLNDTLQPWVMCV